MGIPETIQPAHLSRLAVVYVRQSSPHQVLVNKESLKLQYDLRGQAGAAGWPADHIRVNAVSAGPVRTSASAPTWLVGRSP